MDALIMRPGVATGITTRAAITAIPGRIIEATPTGPTRDRITGATGPITVAATGSPAKSGSGPAAHFASPALLPFFAKRKTGVTVRLLVVAECARDRSH